MNQDEREQDQPIMIVDRRSASQADDTTKHIATMGARALSNFVGGLPMHPTPRGPAITSHHTNGRREERLLAYTTRPKKTLATTKSTLAGKTLPVVRAEPKRPEGISARQFKRMRSLRNESRRIAASTATSTTTTTTTTTPREVT